MITIKGSRTLALHAASGALTTCSIVLQYLDMLGLDDRTYGLVAIGLNLATNLLGWILRHKTTTPVGGMK